MRNQTTQQLLLALALLIGIGVIVNYDWTSSLATETEPVTAGASLKLKQFDSAQEVTIGFEKPTVLMFFTSWCPYCNEDAPKIVALNSKYVDQINLYGINLLYRDEASEVRRYIDTHDIDYPVLVDETGNLYDAIGGSGFPALYFMNAQGEVIDSIVGSTDIETIEDSFANLIGAY